MVSKSEDGYATTTRPALSWGGWRAAGCGFAPALPPLRPDIEAYFTRCLAYPPERRCKFLDVQTPAPWSYRGPRLSARPRRENDVIAIGDSMAMALGASSARADGIAPDSRRIRSPQTTRDAQLNSNLDLVTPRHFDHEKMETPRFSES